MIGRMVRKAVSSSYLADGLDADFNIASMRSYIERKPEMDKVLENLLKPLIKPGLRLLDACCGIGHLIHSLHNPYPNAHFTGFDGAPYLIEEAKKLSSGPNVTFEIANLFKLPSSYRKAFDITLCWKTLSWLPSFEAALKALLATTRRHLFISALFYEGNIDYEIAVKEHTKERGKRGITSHHNIYSLPRFESFARAYGAKSVHSYDFELKIDLPRGNPDYMGTYTIPLLSGKRMQMSGALPMPWKIIHIEV
jgi:SAM-dependent methyltransferase